MHSDDMDFLSNMPGRFIDGDEQFFEESALRNLSNNLGDFQEYDEAQWENVPAFFDQIPSSTNFAEDKDIVIAVMGATGAGKSSFIKTVSGRNDVIVGDSLSSGKLVFYTSQ